MGPQQRYEPRRILQTDGDTEAEGSLTPAKRRRGLLKDLLFYAALAALVLGAFLFKSSNGNTPTTFMGFAAMRVLTGSMEEAIPQGSLIITRAVDPRTLAVGDDITYLASPSTTVTHRIVSITARYADTGQPAFVTQGVMNSEPDRLIVPAANVVGKVIFHSLFLGKVLAFLQAYWIWLLVLAVLFTALCFTLRTVVQETRQNRAQGGGQTDTARRAPPDGRKKV